MDAELFDQTGNMACKVVWKDCVRSVLFNLLIVVYVFKTRRVYEGVSAPPFEKKCTWGRKRIYDY